MKPDCIFCNIVNGKAPASELMYSSPLVATFIPLNPVTPGHRLFVPVLHREDAAEDPRTTGRVFEAAAAFGAGMGGHFNLITSMGAAATQTVWHLHVHYVPRSYGDCLALPWTGQAEH